jgi:ribosomal protein L12E/L44/L45/RPP1/RPP2
VNSHYNNYDSWSEPAPPLARIDYLHDGRWGLFVEDVKIRGTHIVLYDAPELEDIARFAISEGYKPGEVWMSETAKLVVGLDIHEAIFRMRHELASTQENTTRARKRVASKKANPVRKPKKSKKEETHGNTEEDYTDYT